MKFNTFKILTILSVTFLIGCESTLAWEDEFPENNEVSEVESKEITQINYDNLSDNVASSAKFRDEFRSLLLAKQYQKAALTIEQINIDKQHDSTEPTKNINFYVRGMMQDLVTNLQYVNSSTPVAVTSFVMLNSDYNQTNLLGNQIAESLIHEIHKFGIPVLDYKTTDYIMVTPEGDYTFSKDYTELKPGLPIRYVVSGTLVKHLGGYLVNARIIGVTSKAVVASAQSFIPENVANAIMDNVETSTDNLTKTTVSLVEG